MQPLEHHNPPANLNTLAMPNQKEEGILHLESLELRLRSVILSKGGSHKGNPECEEQIRKGFLGANSKNKTPFFHLRATQRIIAAIRILKLGDELSPAEARTIGKFYRKKLDALLDLGLTAHVVREQILSLDLAEETSKLTSKLTGNNNDVLSSFRPWYTRASNPAIRTNVPLSPLIVDLIENFLETPQVQQKAAQADPSFKDSLYKLLYTFENTIFNKLEFQCFERVPVYQQLAEELQYNAEVLKFPASKIIRHTLSSGDQVARWYNVPENKEQLPLYMVHFAVQQSPSKTLQSLKEMLRAKQKVESLPPQIVHLRDESSKKKAVCMARKDPIGYLKRIDKNITAALATKSLHPLSESIDWLKLTAFRYSNKNEFIDYCERALTFFNDIPRSHQKLLFDGKIEHYLAFIKGFPHLRRRDIDQAYTTMRHMMFLTQESRQKHTEQKIRWAIVHRHQITSKKAAKLLLKMK